MHNLAASPFCTTRVHIGEGLCFDSAAAYPQAMAISRREMLRSTAACLGFVLTPSLSGMVGPSEPPRTGFKIGAVDWELTRPSDPEALAVAARLGFDGLQVDLGDLDAMKQPDNQHRYEQLSRRYRIQVASLALGKLGDVPFGTNVKGQELVDAAMDIAREMKQKVLLLAFFGANGFDKEGNKPDLLVGKLKEIAPKAEKSGVVLGLEGEATAEQYRKLIDQVGSPAVKVYFDCVHAHVEGKEIYDEIVLLGDRICEFHAKDYGNILFGQGKVDFRQVRRALDAIGYRGWIHLEQWGEIPGEKPLGFEQTHRRNLEYLRRVFPPV